MICGIGSSEAPCMSISARLFMAEFIDMNLAVKGMTSLLRSVSFDSGSRASLWPPDHTELGKKFRRKTSVEARSNVEYVTEPFP